jgi:hypothetical protein
METPEPFAVAAKALLAAGRLRGLLPHLEGLIDDQRWLELQDGLDILRRDLAAIVTEEVLRPREIEGPSLQELPEREDDTLRERGEAAS